MNMRFVASFVLALSAASLVFADAPSCKTTLEVDTCGHQPVEGRKVKVETSDGDKIREKTDKEGKIVLDVCQEEITELKISGVNSRRVSRTAVTDQTDTEIKTTIALNICGA